MPIPVLEPTAARDGTYGGVTYHIEGELVPVLHVELSNTPVYFEHQILLWKEPKVKIGIKSLQGGFKRVLAGMPVLMMEASGPGQIGFSRDGAGHIMGIHLKHGEGIKMREHQFLAATGTVDYTYTRVEGISNILMGGSGFFIDHFNAQQGEGIVWIHGYGNMFEVTPGPANRSTSSRVAGRRRIARCRWRPVPEVSHRALRQRRTIGVESVHRPGTGRHPINVSAHADCGMTIDSDLSGR